MRGAGVNAVAAHAASLRSSKMQYCGLTNSSGRLLAKVIIYRLNWIPSSTALAKNMHCYVHQPVPAIGLCKNCFRALCPDCAVDVGDGLACHGGCEQKVNELNQMWERSAKIYGVGRHKSRIPPTGVLLWGLMATVMWAVAGFAYFSRGETDISSIVMAFFFTVALGLAIYSARRTGIKC